MNKIYMRKCRQSVEFREEEKIKDEESRKRRKLEERITSDRLLLSEEKVKELRKSQRKDEFPLQDTPVDHKEVQDPCEQNVDQPGEAEEENEEIEKSELEVLEENCNKHIKDHGALKKFTSMDHDEFDAFVVECSPNLLLMTYEGTPRNPKYPPSHTPCPTFIFLTLFWLRYYLTIDIISLLFQIHPRSCTRILKRTTVAMAKTLENEIQFPSDEEMEGYRYTAFQNFGFAECVCVVDGTEIQISRPKDPETQFKTYSGKKKQNSLNVMLITKLNGEIIYYSPLRVGAHDQAHWNELNLREKFVGKAYGIMGDGGFTFNRVGEEQVIHGFKPFKKPAKGTLTDEEKNWNTKLSEVRVVVENSIRVIKAFRVLGGVFRHWRKGQGQINGNNVLTICVSLANRKIKRNPLRSDNWMASDYMEAFELLANDGPDPLREMQFDV